jgi:hypothetical protein
MMAGEHPTTQRVPPGDRHKAEGERDAVTPDVEAATRAHVQESREADRQNIRTSDTRPAPAQPHDDAPTPDQAE